MGLSNLIFSSESDRSEANRPIFEGILEERAQNFFATVDPALSWMERCYSDVIHELDRQRVNSSEVVGQAQQIIGAESIRAEEERIVAEAEHILRSIGQVATLEGISDNFINSQARARYNVTKAIEEFR